MIRSLRDDPTTSFRIEEWLTSKEQGGRRFVLCDDDAKLSKGGYKSVRASVDRWEGRYQR